MDRVRFALAGLLAVAFFIALGLTSLLNAMPLWASGLFMFTVALMSAAILGAIAGRGETRMTWVGVAILGWLYLGIVFGPFKNGNGTTIPPLPTICSFRNFITADPQKSREIRSGFPSMPFTGDPAGSQKHTEPWNSPGKLRSLA
ncbi:MAG: hypothetical protein JWN86_3372 [Planctomycetota bacterium]|nr:hypothetical protein [Planctomycetota bacterium]